MTKTLIRNVFENDDGPVDFNPGDRLRCTFVGVASDCGKYVEADVGLLTYAIPITGAARLERLSAAAQPLSEGEAVFYGTEQGVRLVCHAMGAYVWLSIQSGQGGAGILGLISRCRRENGIPIKMRD